MSDRLLHRLLDAELQLREIDAELQMRGEARPASRRRLVERRVALVGFVDRLERMLGDGRTSVDWA